MSANQTFAQYKHIIATTNCPILGLNYSKHRLCTILGYCITSFTLHAENNQPMNGLYEVSVTIFTSNQYSFLENSFISDHLLKFYSTIKHNGDIKLSSFFKHIIILSISKQIELNCFYPCLRFELTHESLEPVVEDNELASRFRTN